MKNKTLAILAITLLSALAANAQIAQGGTYKLEQAVVSSGGGTSADATGSVYKVLGVTGEPVAGTTSTNSTYAVKGGFLNSPTVAPTAASVSIGGRVLTMNGGGLMNAIVTLTDSNGVSQTVLTKKLGSFRFDDVPVGAIYIITVGSRHYTFQPQVVSVTENTTGLIFNAQGETVFSNTAP